MNAMSARVLTLEDPARTRDTDRRRALWDASVAHFVQPTALRRYYQRQLIHAYRRVIPSAASVLEVGCGTGDLLAALQPGTGVGIDFSEPMIHAARQRHPQLRFEVMDAASLQNHELTAELPFDYIVCADLLNDLWDVQQVLEQLRGCCHPGTRLVLNVYNRLWEFPRRIGEQMGLLRPLMPQNWLSGTDTENFLTLAGFSVERRWQEVLLPFPVPGISEFANRRMAAWPGLRHLALSNFVIARPQNNPGAEEPRTAREARVSVIVPARNEAGNIADIVRRTPEMGLGTEIVFVEGHSRDATWAAIETVVRNHPQRALIALQQSGAGKGDAVRTGFAAASGDLFMILDADLTVPPEELPKFYSAWRHQRGDFVNGVRLVYPMEDRAMRFLNELGNKFFSIAFSWLLNQPIKDTLCGTKVVSREDYRRIEAQRHVFGDFDPFGDFDLLFGAARLGLKIIDLPIRYRERTYGTTNIHRWSHGWLLLRMMWVALRKLKFSHRA